MQTYLIRRLLLVIPTLLVASMLIFLVIRFIPGDVIDLIVNEMAGEGFDIYVNIEKTTEEVRHLLGLDAPIHIQYTRWLGNLFRGDFGVSLWTHEPIARELVGRIPVSAELGIFAMVTALMIAIPIGVLSAVRQETAADYVGRTIAILAISVPGFWVGTLVVVYPSIWWYWSPPLEYIPLLEDPLGNFAQFLLPGFIMGLFLSGITMRMTRTMMLEVLRQDYIRTAWAKGLNERTVIFRHAVKNALIPVVTLVGMQIPMLISGSIVFEQIFTLPGVGRYMIEAISARDYPVIVAINLLVSVVVLVSILAVDLTYAWLDPRVKYK